jgi:hypothetical protein
LCYVIVGCTSLGPAKPNEPFPGPYSFGFNELADKNHLLAHELAKLPELQDGISEEEETALNILAEQYNANPDEFDSMFKQMYNVGIPGVRKYCSPLQALFWIAEEGLLHTINDLISNYCLKKGGYKAWDERIPSEAPGVVEHSITAFFWNGKKYVMDNGRPFKAGIYTWEKYFHPF